MNVKSLKVQHYRKLLDESQLLFVHHSYLSVGEWKKLRRECEKLDFSIEVVKGGLLTVTGMSFSGANAVLSCHSNVDPIVALIATHPKLLLVGACLAGKKSYRSLPVKESPLALLHSLERTHPLQVMMSPQVTLLKILQNANH